MDMLAVAILVAGQSTAQHSIALLLLLLQSLYCTAQAEQLLYSHGYACR
jgi:hypothetical protein